MPRLLVLLRPTADARTRILTLTRQCAHELARKMVEHTRALQRRAVAGTRVKMMGGSRRSRRHIRLTSPSRLRVESDDHDSTRN